MRAMGEGVRFLSRASELRHDSLPAGQDIRGWKVLDQTGAQVGWVSDLYVDAAQMWVRVVVITLDKRWDRPVTLPMAELTLVCEERACIAARRLAGDTNATA